MYVILPCKLSVIIFFLLLSVQIAAHRRRCRCYCSPTLYMCSAFILSLLYVYALKPLPKVIKRKKGIPIISTLIACLGPLKAFTTRLKPEINLFLFYFLRFACYCCWCRMSHAVYQVCMSLY